MKKSSLKQISILQRQLFFEGLNKVGKLLDKVYQAEMRLVLHLEVKQLLYDDRKIDIFVCET